MTEKVLSVLNKKRILQEISLLVSIVELPFLVSRVFSMRDQRKSIDYTT